ncbi:DUF3553 domain-containing protein [Desulfovibrio aerotolerans]|uniref:DUF3553 domain-containing protein n=1 Tax=Solidesulfovibrio aerotolerans TaxID=295255 RepID=A0A7C9ITS7_9BACT|nr:DUF3553 domain-containing protein [Solidesulfovibrio aerotolerans]MYL82780.1 DUF3553 domain-containing protein [Solidesulfovibrio aerotolerans]
MTATIIKNGDYVTHIKLPQWGLGKVIELLESGAVRVFFEFEGEKKMQRHFLTPAQAPESHPVLEKIDLDRALDGTVSFPNLEAAFLKMFPEGFDDQRYLAEERSYRLEASRSLHAELGCETLEALLRAGDYEAVCLLAKKLLAKTTLVFPNEKTALTDGFKKGDDQKEHFAKALDILLYGEGELGPRFTGFVEVLDELGVCKWTIATYFLYLLDPSRHIFIKPTYIQKAAQAYGFDIGYTTRPNWACYQRMLRLVDYVASQLAKRELLNPHDLVDVQGFIWCSIFDGKAARAPKKAAKAKA